MRDAHRPENREHVDEPWGLNVLTLLRSACMAAYGGKPAVRRLDPHSWTLA